MMQPVEYIPPPGGGGSTTSAPSSVGAQPQAAPPGGVAVPTSTWQTPPQRQELGPFQASLAKWMSRNGFRLPPIVFAVCLVLAAVVTVTGELSFSPPERPSNDTTAAPTAIPTTTAEVPTTTDVAEATTTASTSTPAGESTTMQTEEATTTPVSPTEDETTSTATPDTSTEEPMTTTTTAGPDLNVV